MTTRKHSLYRKKITSPVIAILGSKRLTPVEGVNIQPKKTRKKRFGIFTKNEEGKYEY